MFIFIFGHGMPDFRVEIGEDTNGHVGFMAFARFREAVGTNLEITVFVTSRCPATLVVGPYTPNSMLL